MPPFFGYMKPSVTAENLCVLRAGNNDNHSRTFYLYYNLNVPEYFGTVYQSVSDNIRS